MTELLEHISTRFNFIWLE